MLRLTRFIRPYRTPFIIGWLAKLAEAILELFLPLLVAKIIDVGIPQGDKPYILRMGLYLFLLSVAGLAFAAYCQYTAAVASQGTGTRMRHALMEKISTFGYAELDRLETSGLINRITADVNNYQQAVAMTIRLISRAPFLCIGAVILSIRIDSQLTLVFAVVIPLVSLFLYFFMTRTAPLYRAAQKKLDAFASIVRENLSGIRVIRAFARWDAEKQRANHATEELADAYQYVARFSALTNPVTSFIINGGIIALLYFGAMRVYNGNLTRGNILALTTYATQILYSLVIVANLIVLFTKASASSVRILEVLDTEPSLAFVQERVSAFEPAAPAVAFERVEFSYNNTENALHNLSFSMEQGTSWAL